MTSYDAQKVNPIVVLRLLVPAWIAFMVFLASTSHLAAAAVVALLLVLDLGVLAAARRRTSAS